MATETFKFFNQVLDGKKLNLPVEQIRFQADGKLLTTHIEESIAAAVQALKEGDIATLTTNLNSTTTLLNDFLTGGATDNNVVDRVVELVTLINANKNSIEAFTGADGAITLLQSQVSALQSTVAGLEAVKNNTGIAYLANIGDTPVYTGKIELLITEVEVETE